MATRRIAVLNGPNLQRLGAREAEHYGTATYAELEAFCRERGAALGVEIDLRQSDGEGELVGFIHDCDGVCDAIVLNAAAYTHTSVAVRDALLSCRVPVVEVHLSNPDAREGFRRTNLIADVVAAGVRGFGLDGYGLAIAGAVALLD